MTPTPCTICNDTEPSHVHNNGLRIEDYFTVGRGETDFEAALRWRRKYETLKQGGRPPKQNNHDFDRAPEIIEGTAVAVVT